MSIPLQINQPELNLYQDWLEKLVLTSDKNLPSVLNETFVFIYSSIITEDHLKNQSLTNTTAKSMIHLLNHAILRLRSTRVQLDVSYLTRFLTNRTLLWTINSSSPVYTTLPLVLSIVIENWKTTSSETLALPDAVPLAETLANAFDWFRKTGVAPTALLLVCQLFMLEEAYPNFAFSKYFAQALENLDEANERVTLQWSGTTSLKDESLQKVKALGSFIDTLAYFLILPPLDCWDHPLQPYKAFFLSEQEVTFWKHQLNKFLLNKEAWNHMRYLLVSHTNSFPSHVAYIPLLLASHEPYTFIRDEACQILACFGSRLNGGHPILLCRLFQYLVPCFNPKKIQTYHFLDALQKIPLKSNCSLCTNDLVLYDLYKELLKVAKTQFIDMSSNDLTALIFQIYGIPTILNILKNTSIWEKDPTTYLLESLSFLNDFFMFMSKLPTFVRRSSNSRYKYLNNIDTQLNSTLSTRETTFDIVESFYELSQNMQECLIQSQAQILAFLATWKDGKDFQALISLFKLMNLLIEQKTATFILLTKCAEFVDSSFCILIKFLDTWALSFDDQIEKSEALRTLLECMQILKKSMRILYSKNSSMDLREMFITRIKKKMKPFSLKSSLAKREILNLVQLLNKDFENPYILLILLVFQWDADNEMAENATILLSEGDLGETTFVSFFYEILSNFYINERQQAPTNTTELRDTHYITFYPDAHISQWESFRCVQENSLKFNGTVTYDTLIHCLCFATMLAFRKSDSSHRSLPFFERKPPLFTHLSGHQTNPLPLLFFHVTRSLNMLPEISLKKKKSCQYLSYVGYLFLLEQFFFHVSDNVLSKSEMEYIMSVLISCYSDIIRSFFDGKERSQLNHSTEEARITQCTNLCELLEKKTTLCEWVICQSFINSVSTQNVCLLLACDVFFKKTFHNDLPFIVRQQVSSLIEEMKDRPPMVADAYFFFSLQLKRTLLGDLDIHLLECFTQAFFLEVFTAFCSTSDILHPYYIHILNNQIYTQSASTHTPFLSHTVGEKETWVDVLKVTQQRISAMLRNSVTIEIPQFSHTIMYYEELWSLVASLFKLLANCQPVKEQLLDLQFKWIPNCLLESLRLFQNGSVEHCFAMASFFKKIFQFSQDYSCSLLDQANFFFFHLLVLYNGNNQCRLCTRLDFKENAAIAHLTKETVEQESILKCIDEFLRNTIKPVVKNFCCITDVDLYSLSSIILNCIMETEQFHLIVIRHLETIYSLMAQNIFNTNAIVSLSSLRGLLCCIKAMHQNNKFSLSIFLRDNGSQLCLVFDKAYQKVLHWKETKAYTLQCPTNHYYTHFIQMFHSIAECIRLFKHFSLIFLFFLPFLEKYSKAFTVSLPYIFHQNYSTDFLFNISFANIFLEEECEFLIIFLYHKNYEVQWATQRLCCQLFGGESLSTILLQPLSQKENVTAFSKSRCFLMLSKNLKNFYNGGNTLIVQTLTDLLNTPLCWEKDVQTVLNNFIMEIFSVYHQCSKDFVNHQCDAHIMDTYEGLMSAFRQAIIHVSSEDFLLENFLKYLNNVLHLYSSNPKVMNCCFGMLYAWMETFEKIVVSHINEITVFLFTIFSHLVKCYQHTWNSPLSNIPFAQNNSETCLCETLFSTFPLSKPLIEFLALHTTLQVLNQLVKTFVTDLQINQSHILRELTLVFLAMINRETFAARNDDFAPDILFSTLFPFLMQCSSALNKISYEALVRLIPFVSLPVLIKTLRSEIIDKLLIVEATDTFENVCLFRCKAGEILHKVYKVRNEICSSNMLSKSLLIALCYIFKHCNYASKSSWLELWDMVGIYNVFEVDAPFLTLLVLTNLCQLLQSKFEDDLILLTQTLVSMLKSIEIKRGCKFVSFLKKQNLTHICCCSIPSETLCQNPCSVCSWNHLSERICTTISTRDVETIPIPFIQVCLKLACSNILESSIPILTRIFEKTLACEKTYHQGLLLEAIRSNFLSQCVLLELSECDVLCDRSIQSLQRRLEQQIIHQILTTIASSNKSVMECHDLDKFWTYWVSLIKLNEKFLSLKLVENDSIDFLSIWISWVEKNAVTQNEAPCTALTSLLWYLTSLKTNGPQYSDKNQKRLKQLCNNMLTFCTKTLKSLLTQFDESNGDHAILTYLRLEKTILVCYQSSCKNEQMHPVVESLAFTLHQKPTFMRDAKEIFYLCTKKMHFYRKNKKFLDSIFDLVLECQKKNYNDVHLMT